MKPKRLITITSFILLIMMLFTSQFETAHATDIIDVWQSAGGSGIGAADTTTNGVWDNSYQGFRITVLDYTGVPAFTFAGKDYLDLCFTYPYSCSYYGLFNKTQAYRQATSKKSDLVAKAQIVTIGDIYSRLKSGGYQTTAAGDVQKAISNFGNLPKYLLQSGNSWYMQGEKVKEKMYGTGDDEIDPSAALYVIMNLNNNGKYFWQPKSSAIVGTPFTDAEKAALANGSLTPIELMASRGLVVSVEPIIWNQLRISETQFSRYSVYGTQTDVGYICNKLIEAGTDFAKADGGGRNGGYDWAIFGKYGRKAMITTKPIIFYAYNQNGNVINGTWTITPPVDNVTAVDNKTVMAMQPGWSLHLYKLKAKEDKTHTWDSNKYPESTPTTFKEHPAPDPKEDPLTKDKVEQLKEKLHYNIVKFYEQEILKDDGTSEIIHVATYERRENLSKSHDCDVLFFCPV